MKSLAYLLVLLPASLAAQQDPRQRILAEEVPRDLWMEASLYKVARIAEEIGTERAVQEAEARRMIRGTNGGFNVELVHRDPDHRFSPAEVTGPGISWDMAWNNRASLYVEVDALIPLARSFSGAALLEEVVLPPENFEGMALQNADEYVAAGKDGSGIKIAVIDYGFDSLSEVIGAGGLPAMIDTTSFTNGNFMQYGGKHGTGCLEAIYDNAPGATYYAYRIANGTHFGAAINDCIAEGMDIISVSLGPHNEGWADDSGPFCTAVISACNAGVLVFVSAGNEALKHWQGNFVDDGGPAPRWHVWSGLDTGNSVNLGDSTSISVWLQWNADPPGDPYDLYFYDSGGNILESSTSSNAFETGYFDNQNPNDTLVHILVQAKVASPPEFEIFCDRSLQYAVATSSIESPGNVTHPNQITVGAVDRLIYTDPAGSDPIIDYSSLGPTNSGNQAPDIAAPTNTFSDAYDGTFGGTSCATPNAAGAAAALWSAHPDYNADGIRQLVLRMAELHKDWGPPGLDMTYGHGGLFLNTYAPNPEYIHLGSGNTTGTSSIPYSSIQQADQYAPQNSNTFFLGGTFPEPPPGTIIDGPMIYRSVQHDATVE